jgi:hypothetical protein
MMLLQSINWNLINCNHHFVETFHLHHHHHRLRLFPLSFAGVYELSIKFTRIGYHLLFENDGHHHHMQSVSQSERGTIHIHIGGDDEDEQENRT